MRHFGLLVLIWLLLAGPAAACDGYLSPIGREHPLACRIYAADGTETARQDLLERLDRAPLVVLGEVHDNADHHRLRAQLIAELGTPQTAAPPHPPAVVMEHLRADQSAALEAYRAAIMAAPPEGTVAASVAGLLSDLDWGRSGWPDAQMFEPIFLAVRRGLHPLMAGDPERSRVRSVARQGLAALPPDEIARVGADQALPGSSADALLVELEASHCGLMPKSALGGMADAQRYRDAHLARALADAMTAHGRAVLLTGNGHARRDRGVPWHLARLAPERPVVVVLFVEVAAGQTHLRQVNEQDGDGRPLGDYVWLTPRVERPDPCIEMRKRFGR